MALDADAIIDAIADNVSKPRAVTTDAGSVQMHDLAQAFEVARKLKADEAKRAGAVGVTFRQFTFGSSRIV